MIQPTIENENIQERQHSCKWYFDEATGVYDGIRGTDGKSGRLKQKMDAIDKLLSNDDFLANTEKSEKVILDYKHLLGVDDTMDVNNRPMSVFPLFVCEIPASGDDESIMQDTFEKKKFEICKVLNAIDSVVSRLCTDNVDNTYQSKANVVGADTILKWLYSSSNVGGVTKQQADRATVLMRQIVKWYLEQKNKQKNDAKIKEQADLLLKIFQPSTSSSIETNDYWWDSENCQSALREDVQKAIEQTVDDIEEAYQKLNGFRRYAIRFEMATLEMKKEVCLNKLLSLANAIWNFFTCVCVAYMRINNLQLPRAEFGGARLIHTNISGSNFSNANFGDVDMSCAIAKDCDFSSSSLRDVMAANADLSGSLFSYADMSGADLSGATMSSVKMDMIDVGNYSIVQWRRILDSINSEMKNGDKKDSINKMQGHLLTIINGSKPNKDGAKGEGVADVDNGEKAFPPKIPEGERGYLQESSMKVMCDVYKSYIDAKIERCKALSVDGGTYTKLKELVDPNGDTLKKLIKLDGVSLKSSMLSKLNLSLVDMNGASFENSDMSGCVLAFVNAKGADFTTANLTSAQAYHSQLEGASFARALLFGMDFVDCFMEGINFSGANLTDVKIINSDMANQNYIGQTVETIRLNDNYYPIPIPRQKEEYGKKRGDAKDGQRGAGNDPTVNCDSIFNDVIASRILVAGCDFCRSTFAESQLRSSILFDVNASSTVWDNADLMYSLLYGVVFNRSSMRKVSLQESKLYACDFSCCNLLDSKMLGCTFDKAVFYDSNMNKANLSHSIISNSIFRESAIEGLNVSNSQFIGCLFIDVDFSDCIGLRNAVFEGCSFIRCRDKNGEMIESWDGSKEILLKINELDLVGSDVNEESGMPRKFSTLKDDNGTK